MKAEKANYRVIKTLRPDDRGALALAERYGSALVCVRHRTDAKGKVRHMTIELLIDSTPIRPRTIRLVHIQTAPHERELNAIIKTAGGRWDYKQRQWLLPSRVATILNLRDRIVEA